jgi:hypothetical protein
MHRLHRMHRMHLVHRVHRVHLVHRVFWHVTYMAVGILAGKMAAMEDDHLHLARRGRKAICGHWSRSAWSFIRCPPDL